MTMLAAQYTGLEILGSRMSEDGNSCEVDVRATFKRLMSKNMSARGWGGGICSLGRNGQMSEDGIGYDVDVRATYNRLVSGCDCTRGGRVRVGGRGYGFKHWAVKCQKTAVVRATYTRPVDGGNGSLWAQGGGAWV